MRGFAEVAPRWLARGGYVDTDVAPTLKEKAGSIWAIGSGIYGSDSIGFFRLAGNFTQRAAVRRRAVTLLP